MKTKELLLSVLTFTSTSIALAGNGVGNGGDPLRPLFEDARTAAAQFVAQLKPCSFDSKAAPAAVTWILKNQESYSNDIARTKHDWITDSQPTCAWTHDWPNAEITLSFEACRPLIRTQAEAVHQLFHESVHHFGITDEDFAELVARALDGARQVPSCPTRPQDAFDPDACEGAPITPKDFLSFFKEGGKPVLVGHPTPVQFRKRKCISDTEDSCSDWEYFESNINPRLPGMILFTLQPVLRISSGMQVSLKFPAYTDRDFSDRTTHEMPVTGIGSSRISAKYDFFPWEGLTFVPFDASGRMTKDCLVLQYRHNLENETAVLISLR